MADARALLRQQRTARRITHPLAFYSDAGKLICKLCREPIRTESQWEDHVRSQAHVKRQKEKQQQQSQIQSIEADETNSHHPPTADAEAESSKRKFQEDEDEQVSDANNQIDPTNQNGEGARASKRNRPDIDTDAETPPKAGTPPSLARRPSATPSQGVELQIPSRPATPGQGGNQTPQNHRRNESVSSHMNGERGLPSRQNSSLLSTSSFATNPSSTNRPISQEKLPSTTTSSRPGTSTAATSQDQQIDEAEWAAFQEDLAALPQQNQNQNHNSAIYSEATISAAPMTAEESLAQREMDMSLDETVHKFSEREVQRREDERDDAMRALELEFEEMEDYEQRVKRLKEKREQLEVVRERRASGLGERPKVENLKKSDGAAVEAVSEESDESDDEEDEDEDDWDGFRIRR